MAYILPKSKKGYTTARPIIASSDTAFGPLFQILGFILKNDMPVAYPDTYGNRTMAQLLRELHMKLQESKTVGFRIFNDDLKGFFTSVPHAYIQDAVQHMLTEYVKRHPNPSGKPVSFTVPVRTTSKSRLIRGKSFTKSSTNHVVLLRDLPGLVRAALQFSFFTCMGTLYRQSRGAVIGGQASPALCALAVTYKEHVWQHAYGILTNPPPHMLCIRYVDNRLTIIHPELLHHAAYKRFTHLHFYDPPVELEPCGDDKFLEYAIDFMLGSCLYIVPSHAHEYRSTRSASSTARALSGMTARLHLFYRGTYPSHHCPRLVQELLHHYNNQGFPMFMLHSLASRVKKVYCKKP